jgi:small subunit ribosomal protein S1
MQNGRKKRRCCREKSSSKKKQLPKLKQRMQLLKKKRQKKETPKAEKVEEAPKVEAKKSAPKKKGEIKPLADFDWSTISKREEKYPEAEQKEMEEAYDATLTSIEEQQVLDGSVVRKTNRDVVINIGYKSEAVISISEFRYNPELKEGDAVEVFVVSQEDKNGQLILSQSKARDFRAWDKVNEVL